MSEYEQRQYRLMRDRLDSFERGSVDIARLINDLSTLLSSLESAGKDWKEAFRNEWWTLEEAYSVALDREESVSSLVNDSLINGAVENMKRLLAQMIEAERSSDNAEL